MCGAIRYELEGDSLWNVYCHCRSCQKHTGAPVAAFVTYLPDQVRWISGDRALYQSSPGRHRAFCRDCGTSLTYETVVNDEPWTVIHIGTLDKPKDFQPVEHVFCADGISWFDVDDDLPRREGSKFI